MQGLAYYDVRSNVSMLPVQYVAEALVRKSHYPRHDTNDMSLEYRM
jgi:hypothetical protein